ncbi:MAG: S1 RNA-binding domain-containing protein [Anaerolineae bacterium]|nr:S1 RNA-binding domain-containing protein [Anaerolineae bacterium]
MSEERTPMSEDITETPVTPEAETSAPAIDEAETTAAAAETTQEPVVSEVVPAAETAEPPAAEESAAPVAEEAAVSETAAEAEAPEEVAAPVAEEAAASETAAEAETAEHPAAEEAAAPVAEEAAASAPVAEVETVEAPAAAPAAAPGEAPKSIDDLEPGMELNGTVKRIELYGAFVDLGIGKDGLLHISQLGKPDVRNVEDVVSVGQQLSVYVLKVDKDQGRIALSLTKPVGVSWDTLKQGMDVSGTIVKIENFGVFVDFGAERPGMIHVSELASGYVRSPEDVVKVGETVTARIIKLDRRKKRIDLSLKALTEKVEHEVEAVEEEVEHLPTAMELALRRAMQNGDPEKARIAQKRARRNRKDDEMEDIISRTLRSHQNQK